MESRSIEPVEHNGMHVAPKTGPFLPATVRVRLDLPNSLARIIVPLLGGRKRCSKTGEGRIVYLTAGFVERLREHIDRVQALGRGLGQVNPVLVPNLPRQARQWQVRWSATPGLPDRVWDTATRRAGQVGKLRHDLRRIGVRDMVKPASRSASG